MDTRIVTIDLDSRSYDIYIGSGLLYRLTDYLPDEVEDKTLFIVADKNTQVYADRMKAMLMEGGARSVEICTIAAGEQTKSLATAEKIIAWLLDNKANRDSMIFAVGGGVVGDLTGFCASVTMRGIPYIQVPTTLLAQVDSSVGGKTGVNTPHGKNLIGSFYQPAAVIADLETLKTLPERQLMAGYAEIVKYGLIRDIGFFHWLEQNGRKVCALDEEALAHAIEISCQAKAAIVEADEHETGRRALLNLGHTFGHALEAAARYDGRLLHGEAVAIGIITAFELSLRMGLCKREDVDRVEAHYASVGLPSRASYIQPALKTTADDLYEIMKRDKKARAGKIRFILVNGIGEAFVSDEAPETMVKDVLRETLGGEEQEKEGLWTRVFSSHS